MIFYMIRDRVSGLYWQATDSFFGLGEWVEQKVASVWTTVPPMRDIKIVKASPEIVTFVAHEKRDAVVLVPAEPGEDKPTKKWYEQ